MRQGLLLAIILFFSYSSYSQYKTVKIGKTTWMAENLNINVEGSYVYNGQPELSKKYGRLYSWEAAKKACPSGWRLPEVEDWDELIKQLGTENTAAKAIKMNGASEFNAPYAGYSNGQTFFFAESFAGFWTATEYDTQHAWYYFFTNKSDALTKSFFSKNYAFSVRCVKK